MNICIALVAKMFNYSPYFYLMTEGIKMEGRAAEVPLPWEFGVKKFKDVRIVTNTGTEQFNFWEMKGDMLEIGYDGAKETTSGVVLGELVDIGKGGYILIIDSGMKKEIVDDVLPAVLEGVKKEGIKVNGTKAQKAAKKMNRVEMN